MDGLSMIIGGFFSVILYIVLVFAIPPRLLKIIENQKILIRIQMKTAVSLGAMTGRTCVKCGDVHVPNMLEKPLQCPNCKISYEKDKVICKRGDVIFNYSKSYFKKNKDKDNLELIWQYDETI